MGHGRIMAALSDVVSFRAYEAAGEATATYSSRMEVEPDLGDTLPPVKVTLVGEGSDRAFHGSHLCALPKARAQCAHRIAIGPV